MGEAKLKKLSAEAMATPGARGSIVINAVKRNKTQEVLLVLEMHMPGYVSLNAAYTPADALELGKEIVAKAQALLDGKYSVMQ